MGNARRASRNASRNADTRGNKWSFTRVGFIRGMCEISYLVELDQLRASQRLITVIPT